jgi:hypothetical protein
MADNTPTKPVPPPAEAAGSAEAPAEKSKNADKNEAKRLAKLEKFQAKQKVCISMSTWHANEHIDVSTNKYLLLKQRLPLRRLKLPLLPRKRRRSR